MFNFYVSKCFDRLASPRVVGNIFNVQFLHSHPSPLPLEKGGVSCRSWRQIGANQCLKGRFAPLRHFGYTPIGVFLSVVVTSVFPGLLFGVVAGQYTLRASVRSALSFRAERRANVAQSRNLFLSRFCSVKSNAKPAAQNLCGSVACRADLFSSLRPALMPLPFSKGGEGGGNVNIEIMSIVALEQKLT